MHFSLATGGYHGVTDPSLELREWCCSTTHTSCHQPPGTICKQEYTFFSHDQRFATSGGCRPVCRRVWLGLELEAYLTSPVILVSCFCVSVLKVWLVNAEQSKKASVPARNKMVKGKLKRWWEDWELVWTTQNIKDLLPWKEKKLSVYLRKILKIQLCASVFFFCNIDFRTSKCL